VVANISRIGLRYINVFKERNVFIDSLLKVSLSEKDLCDREINLTITKPCGEFKSRLVMVNNAKVNFRGQNKIVDGSLVDIDVFLEKNIDVDKLDKLVDSAHSKEKELFFSLLKPEYLASLNPEY
jgi:uncharacterized protein (TIGR04255 family)